MPAAWRRVDVIDAMEAFMSVVVPALLVLVVVRAAAAEAPYTIWYTASRLARTWPVVLEAMLLSMVADALPAIGGCVWERKEDASRPFVVPRAGSEAAWLMLVAAVVLCSMDIRIVADWLVG